MNINESWRIKRHIKTRRSTFEITCAPAAYYPRECEVMILLSNMNDHQFIEL